MAIHWYVGNSAHQGYAADDFASYMAISELLEERISTTEGIIAAMRSARKIEHEIPIAVDEWNVWYRVHNEGKLEEVYNLEDALVVAMHFNAFIRHAATVKMANIAQIVNVIAPIFTSPDGVLLQTTFYPFEIYSATCGSQALDAYWSGDSFSGGGFDGLPLVDVSATLDPDAKRLSVYAVNRSEHEATEATVRLVEGRFAGPVQSYVVNGPDIKAVNTFDDPHRVVSHKSDHQADGTSFDVTFEPHSVTALVFDLA
jgi:alpha-N-arabinofuranosidase